MKNFFFANLKSAIRSLTTITIRCSTLSYSNGVLRLPFFSAATMPAQRVRAYEVQRTLPGNTEALRRHTFTNSFPSAHLRTAFSVHKTKMRDGASTHKMLDIPYRQWENRRRGELKIQLVQSADRQLDLDFCLWFQISGAMGGLPVRASGCFRQRQLMLHLARWYILIAEHTSQGLHHG